MRRRPFLSALLIAAVVALSDLVIKLCALILLGERTVELTSWLGLGVHFNPQMGWGLSTGVSPSLLTLAATATILVMGWLVLKELVALDRWSPLALGLLAGAGIANAFDGLIPPSGAVDFIIVAHSGMQTVLNGADLAVMMGVGLCCRTAMLLGVAIDRERRRRPSRVVVPEIAVQIPMHAEPGLTRARSERERGDRPWERPVSRPDDIAPRPGA